MPIRKEILSVVPFRQESSTPNPYDAEHIKCFQHFAAFTGQPNSIEEYPNLIDFGAKRLICIFNIDGLLEISKRAEEIISEFDIEYTWEFQLLDEFEYVYFTATGDRLNTTFGMTEFAPIFRALPSGKLKYMFNISYNVEGEVDISADDIKFKLNFYFKDEILSPAVENVLATADGEFTGIVPSTGGGGIDPDFVQCNINALRALPQANGNWEIDVDGNVVFRWVPTSNCQKLFVDNNKVAEVIETGSQVLSIISEHTFADSLLYLEFESINAYSFYVTNSGTPAPGSYIDKYVELAPEESSYYPLVLRTRKIGTPEANIFYGIDVFTMPSAEIVAGSAHLLNASLESVDIFNGVSTIPNTPGLLDYQNNITWNLDTYINNPGVFPFHSYINYITVQEQPVQASAFIRNMDGVGNYGFATGTSGIRLDEIKYYEIILSTSLQNSGVPDNDTSTGINFFFEGELQAFGALNIAVYYNTLGNAVPFLALFNSNFSEIVAWTGAPRNSLYANLRIGIYTDPENGVKFYVEIDDTVGWIQSIDSTNLELTPDWVNGMWFTDILTASNYTGEFFNPLTEPPCVIPPPAEVSFQSSEFYVNNVFTGYADIVRVGSFTQYAKVKWRITSKDPEWANFPISEGEVEFFPGDEYASFSVTGVPTEEGFPTYCEVQLELFDPENLTIGSQSAALMIFNFLS